MCRLRETGRNSPPIFPRHWDSTNGIRNRESCVITKIPKVTGRLRERTLELASDTSDIVNRIYVLLLENDENYARVSSTFDADLRESLNLYARLWLTTLLSGQFLSQPDMEAVANLGRKNLHHGHSLASLLSAFRLGSREFLGEFFDLAKSDSQIRDELLFDVVCYSLEYTGVVSQATGQAYLDEQFERLRWRDSLRYQLSNVIFQFAHDQESFHRVANALGLDPTVPRVALAFDLKLMNSPASRTEGEFDSLTLVASRQMGIVYEDLVHVFHRGRLVMWVPCIQGDTLVVADCRIMEHTVALVKRAPMILTAGIGLMNQGPAGWAMSVEEAFKALDLGRRVSEDRTIFCYSDIAVNESVRKTDNVLRYLNSLLERLSTEPELLTTLQTFFDRQQRRKMTADALGIHPNTLNYRLERIEKLLGATLQDGGWIAKLYVALKLRQQTHLGPEI